MLFFLILFSSTFFSIYHLISSYNFKDRRVLYKVKQKGISVLVPCYNEDIILPYTIEGILNIEYDNLEVIFINDGSIDNTFNVMHELLDLNKWETTIPATPADKVKGIYKSNKYPFIYVIDKYNSGKANSLNVGTLYAQEELIVTMDGDCILDTKALQNMNVIFEDNDIIASGGVVHIMQMFKLDNELRPIVLMQALDYIKGFYVYKASLAYNDALSIISGAFGVFRRNTILDIGGFRAGLGEDIDITLRIQEYAKNNNKKVVFNKKAICYTECPESIRELVGQRVRWQKGFIDAILNNSIFLIKNIFKNSVCFYIIVDALLSNSFATVVFVVNLILIFMKVIYNYPLSMLVYYSTTLMFNIISSVIAIKRAKINIPELKTKPLYTMILFDIAFFQFFRIFFFLKGTLLYYFNNEDWHKVARTNNYYKL